MNTSRIVATVQGVGSSAKRLRGTKTSIKRGPMSTNVSENVIKTEEYQEEILTLEEVDDLPPAKRVKLDVDTTTTTRVRVQTSPGRWREALLTQSETHKFSLRLVRNPKLKLESQIKLEDTNDDDEAEISHLPYIPLADWEEIETYNRDAPGSPDHLNFNLKMVVVGFNPGNKSGAARMHYANPQNHFWQLMREVGFVAPHIGPKDDFSLIEDPIKIGFTNIVSRITPSSADLSKTDYTEGAVLLTKKLRHFKPGIICFNGKGVFLPFMTHVDPVLGKQLSKTMKFGQQDLQLPGFQGTTFFVMPSTSGRVSGYQKADKKVLFEQLKLLYDEL